MKNISVLLLVITINVYAQIDNEFTYQGELIFNSAPANGDFDFKFVAYDSEDDGTGNVLSTVTIDSPTINVTDGVFTANINFPDDVFLGDKVWLEINVKPNGSVNPFQKLLPRQQVTSTPYAIHAQFVSADAISGVEIQDGTVTASELANNSVATSKIVNNSITDIKLADNSVTTDKIITDGVTFEKIANNSINSKRVIDGSLKAVDIDDTEIQQRINGSCIFPEYLTSISQAGNVVCARMPIGAPNTLDSAGDVGRDTSIAIGVDNNPIISYYDSSNGNLKIVKCNNPSCSTFNTPVTIDSAGFVGVHSDIAIGADNNPIISYYDTSNTNLKIVKCSNPSCSTFNTPITIDSAGSVGRDTSITISTDGNPIISYYAPGFDDLKTVKCNNPSCSITNTPVTLDSAGDVGEDSSIAIGADGNPIISYLDSSNGNLKIVKCSNPSCSATITPLAIDSTGFVGEYTNIAIGSAGNPIISYRDSTNSALKIIKCLNQSCSASKTPVTLDSADGVGFHTNIAIGADSNPIVSYYDSTNDNLKIVKCINQSCSAFNTPVALDTAGDVGRYNSIAISADGNPIISYQDNTNGNLKVYSCGDPVCQN